MDDEDGGLLNIEVSDAEEDDEKQSRRTGQTEAEFQAVRREYLVKVENGEIHKSVTLPIPKDSSKHYIQEAIHAVEELYFLRRFSEALEFLDTVLDGKNGDSLPDDAKKQLKAYATRCRQRLETTESES